LAVARTRKEWVYSPKAKNNGEWADMMSVTLSADHRTVDGAVAA
jgi:pyruvate/2-oxoglutarate dehydrogenase complex dihydrolipoamide acyltransferase (E2) component